jgi:hypothetical protein
MGRKLNRQPIGIAGTPFIIRPHPERPVWMVRLTDVPERAWRMRLNREAPTAPDVAIAARQGVIRFEATPANLRSQVAIVRALVAHANAPAPRVPGRPKSH